MEHNELRKTNATAQSKVNILGVGISAIYQEFVLDQIDAWIVNDDREYISNCTVNTVMECQKNISMLEAINNASLATPDGMPLVWLANWGSDHPVGRVYGPDLMLAVCERSVHLGHKHYLYGGAKGVPELLAAELKNRYAGLQIVGEFSPPFRSLTPEEEDREIEMINDADPDIIWVGLGTPKQDLWMAKHRPRLNASVIIAVGAAFDFHTKRKKQAPVWMQRNGLEWLYRLIQEPNRLWYRYLVHNPWFVLKLIEQQTGLREYPLRGANVQSLKTSASNWFNFR
ncbi:MAG: WecB/TagA/CpsF family glycosyltransferase [Chloroflexi bacterium]|jgi:N-acetylglucosaminyldiphosphoundecaprenol N-acetyl-beta-D-mannosaminyltransferase|nr:WecB/TagA/CpsF family glycosyltransferase [Chloroflexota bacterium]